MQPRRYSRTFA